MIAHPTPRWCLVAYLTDDEDARVWAVLTLTEDCLDSATERGWLILARESDILKERI